MGREAGNTVLIFLTVAGGPARIVEIAAVQGSFTHVGETEATDRVPGNII